MLGFEDYLLKCTLKWETKHSEMLQKVEKLARPFTYKLHIRQDRQTREKVSNIPETFNYLHVQSRKVYDDSGRGRGLRQRRFIHPKRSALATVF